MTQPSNIAGVSGERLILLVERIERLSEEKSGLADDISEVYAEAKSAGYDTKAIREIVKIRKKDRQKRQEEEMILETYKSALGIS